MSVFFKFSKCFPTTIFIHPRLPGEHLLSLNYFQPSPTLRMTRYHRKMADFSSVTHWGAGGNAARRRLLCSSLNLGRAHHIVWAGCWMSLRKIRGHLSTRGLLPPAALNAPPLGQLRAREGRDKTGAEKGLRVCLTTRVVTSPTLGAGSDRGSRTETGFLINKHRETPTNRACKTFFSLPLPDFISNVGGGGRKGKEEKELTK